MTNYRPIEVLTFLSTGEVMHSKFSHYLCIVAEQFSFRKGMSTENASFKLMDSVFKSLNSRMHGRGIFCDLVKACGC